MKIKELVLAEKLDFLAIQETKLESFSDSLPHCLWGNDDCAWACLPAI
ncbi:endonuclease/exonuclease/phosphatase family protein, partial [Trifolium medium]|nr:endonuclease/exonuclease/phosphatase family protein [Trifolium medium]